MANRSNSMITPEVVLFMCLLAVLSFATYSRNHTWSDGVALWTDSAAKSPGQARPNNNAGDALVRMGRFAEAIPYLKRALAADPRYVEPHYNMGVAYMRTGRLDEAVPEFKEVISIEETLRAGHFGHAATSRYLLMAHASLGNIYILKGLYSRAVTHYRKALRLAPGETSIRFNLALAYRRAGLRDEAIAELEEILRIDPTDREARYNLFMLKKDR